VDTVSWFDALEYANRLSLTEGLTPCYVGEGLETSWPLGLDCEGYRLPTDAEWEYAARAGATTAFHSGEIESAVWDAHVEPALQDVAWYGANAGNALQPVATRDPNDWGLYDMHGNLSEWVWDAYVALVIEDGRRVDPILPENEEGVLVGLRVARSCCYYCPAVQCRAAFRDHSHLDQPPFGRGLRLARSLVFPPGYAREECNDEDDDGDGDVDEGPDGQPLTRSCWTDDEEWTTQHVGTCRAGRQTCSGGAWQPACDGRVLPASELWNGLDDDCDGEVDEGFEPLGLDWVSQAGGADATWTEGRGVAALPDGSALVTGFFHVTVDFGMGRPGETELTSLAGSDLYVARYAADGELVWIRQAGGPGADEGWSIAALPDGSAVVAGIFTDTVTLGEGEEHETTLAAEDGRDFFLARYDADGSLAWATRLHHGGGDNGYPRRVAVFPDGTSIMAGGFFTSLTLAPGEPEELSLSSGGAMDAFLACYDAAGSPLWALSAGGDGPDMAYGVAVDAATDTLFVTGMFAQTAYFLGPGGQEQDQLTVRGGKDAFVARYDRTGALLAAWRAGGEVDDFGMDVAVLPDGEAVVTGAFGSLATFEEGDAPTTLQGTDGWRDVFVARYRPDGTLVWAKRAGGPGRYDEPSAVAALSDGTSLVAGHFQDTATFGPGEDGETPLTSQGDYSAFVALYDADGSLVWATAAQSGTQTLCADVAGLSDRASRVALAAGRFLDDAVFGEGDREVTLNAPGRTEMYLMRLLDYGPSR